MIATKPEIGTGIIRKTPGVMGGDACVGRRRLAVWQLVEAKRMGIPDEKQLTMYLTIPMTHEELQAAWDYYDHNKEEIENCIRDNELSDLE